MRVDAMEMVVGAIREVKGDTAPSRIDAGDSLVLRLGFDSMNIALLSLALERECGCGIALDGWITSTTDPEALWSVRCPPTLKRRFVFMRQPPFRRDFRQGVIELTLDTPGTELNVLTREAAAYLCDALREVRSSGARAVLFRSGKPRSFVNGVGLMLAGAIKKPEDAAVLTRPIREAYRAFRDCPVPTIAAIEGNCYGCGVELVLQCRYRLAVDTFDTHFRMTELADYLFLPTFGGTQDLPRLLGLGRAADFVLWGERWSARQAVEFGLVDRCFSQADFGRGVAQFIDAIPLEVETQPSLSRRGNVTVETHDEVVHRNRSKISILPPAYRRVYSSGFDLLDRASQKFQLTDDDYEREAGESAQSILAAPCRAAWPFFFIRQMARAVARGGAASTGALFETADLGLSDLCTDLSYRCALSPTSAQGAKGNAPFAARGDEGVVRLRLGRYTHEIESVAEEGAVRVVEPVGTHGFDPVRGLALYAPLRGIGIEVAEVAFVGSVASGTEQVLSAALAGPGALTLLRTRPRKLFVLDDLLATWLGPQLAYLGSGGSPADLACSLRTFGFTRLAGDWVGRVDFEALCTLARERMPDRADLSYIPALPTIAAEDGVDDPTVVNALLVSLGAFAARMLRDGCLSHPVVVDVAARDVVDFPLQHTSLCRYFTLSKAKALLEIESTIRHLLAHDEVSSLKEFVANGREYYLGRARE